MDTSGISGVFAAKPRIGVVILVLLVSLALPYIPIVNLIVGPILSFTTGVHEMSHAIACLLTGGSVAGMSIVSDGEGHGGLTYCRGGIPFIYSQAGYIGTALFGAALIWLGRFPRLSKYTLVAIGGGFALASATFMVGTILSGQIIAGLLSLALGLAIGAGIVFIALKSNFYWANLLLLFLGVQTGLNAVNDDVIVVEQALGFFPNTWSDASNMANMTGVPAPIWALWWTVLAVGLLGWSVWQTYKTR